MMMTVYLNNEKFPIHFNEKKQDRKHMEEFLEWFQNGESKTFKLYFSEEQFYIVQRSAINLVDVYLKK